MAEKEVKENQMSNKERNEFQPALPLSVAFCWWDDVSENWVCPPRNLSFFISSGRLFPFLTEEDDPPQLFSSEPARVAEVFANALSARGMIYPFTGCFPRAAGLEYILLFLCVHGLIPPCQPFDCTPFDLSLCAH